MSPRLPQLSGEELVRALEKLGHIRVRQRGSHILLKRIAPAGEHTITVPNHRVIAKGTLNDILSRVSLWCGITKDELISRI